MAAGPNASRRILFTLNPCCSTCFNSFAVESYDKLFRFYPPDSVLASIKLLISSGEVAWKAQPNSEPPIFLISSNISSLYCSVNYLLSLNPNFSLISSPLSMGHQQHPYTKAPRTGPLPASSMPISTSWLINEYGGRLII